jgi:hypothetical protein
MELSGAVWQKSIYSGSNGCVEVAFVNDQVAVRDSKDRLGPVLVFTIPEWEAFTKGVQDQQFHHP